MRALITGDLHLTDNPRDGYRHDFMEVTLPELIKEHKVGDLYILGDLTEAFDHHSAVLTNAIAGYIHRLAGLCPVTIQMGNHDYTTTKSPFFAFLKYQPNVKWVGSPTTVGPNWLMLPHTSHYEETWKGIDFSQWDLILAHQTFAGADIGARRLEGIPLDIFPKGVRVISGDIHTPQSFGPITYVGAPYTIDFGDDYAPRVLLMDGKKLTSIPVPGPQKRLVDVKMGQPLPKGTEFNEDDIFKIRVKVTMSQMERWQEFKQASYEWADKHGFTLWEVRPVVDPADRKRIRNVVERNATSDKDLVRAYGKLARVSDRTLTTGLWLLEQ